MVFPPLDIPTLFAVSALVIAFAGCVLILARGSGDGAVPLLLWGGSMLLAAAGIVLMSLAPLAPVPLDTAATVVILLGVAMSWSGARLFAGRRMRPVLAGAGAAGWLVVSVTGLPTALLTALAFLLGAAYVLAAAAELWRGRAERLPTRPAAIALLVIHGLIYLVEAASRPFAGDAALGRTLLTVLMLEALLHATAMAFLFLALMKERAERRTRLYLMDLATRDGLTGLGNRRLFDEKLRDGFAGAIRSRGAIGLLMIDVDHFKAFNDTYGHLQGDECLRSVARGIGAALRRSGDLATRYGGEEFAVLLPGTDKWGVTTVAEQVRASVAELAIAHSGCGHGTLSISVGGASVRPQPGDSADALVQAADAGLYEAKMAGRNTVRIVGGQGGSRPAACIDSAGRQD